MSKGFTAPAVFLAGAALVVGAAFVPEAAATAPAAGQTGPARTVPAGQGQETARTTSAEGAQDGRTHTVTLLTGDVVEYQRKGPDEAPSVTVHPAPRPEGADVTFATFPDSGGGYLVLPSDVGGLVSAGAVDDELFDVETLIEEGLADGDEPLPVIVTYGGDVTRRAVQDTAAALPASDPTTTLESINGVALKVRTDQADRFWAALRETGRRGTSTLSGSARAVWLDRRVHALLDQSVPLVGAPTAWATGLDGSGVTVAVLDTGIDRTHPDLADRVVEAADFTGSGDTADRTGHGTHVASTVVGTGAASDGRYRGVAPGADLLAGKVLDDRGDGNTSWLIEGMEWAAEQGADVVNVSLGTPWSTDGTDPASLALDRLTEEYDTLFVAAAGNAGDTLTVSSPAVADRALAVGAVDKVTGTSLGSYSSRGPRPADAAVKPNIVAPGTDIVAARSSTAPTEPAPGNDRYTTGRGTSMAAPHVAGAAAILRQQHPDWDAGQVRDALTSTARLIDRSWFEQGSGVLDLARAVTQEVHSTAAVDFHRLAPGSSPATRQLTYRNASTTPVTLELSLRTQGWSGEPVPADAVRLGSGAGDGATLTVPPQGSATVDLTVDPSIGDAGAYGGWVTARTDTGDITLTTAFGYYTGPETYELDVSLLTSYGTAEFYGGYGPNVLIYAVPLRAPSAEDPFNPLPWHMFEADNSGHVTITLPEGEYELIGKASERFIRTRSSWVIETVSVTRDRPVTLDARETVPLRPLLPEPVDGTGSVKYVRTFDDRPEPFTLTTGLPDDASAYHGDVFITPAAAPTVGERHLAHQWSFEPAVLADATAGHGRRDRLDLHPAYDVDDLADHLTESRTLPVVWGGRGTPEDLDAVDLEGNLVLVGVPLADDEHPYITASTAMDEAAAHAEERGAAGFLGYLDVPEGGQRLPSCRCDDAFLRLGLDAEEGRALRAALAEKAVSLTLTPRQDVEPVYRLRFDDDGAVSKKPERLGQRDLARIDASYHADQEGARGRDLWTTTTGEPWSELQLGDPMTLPTGRTEYVGPPRPDLTWTRTVSGPDLDMVSHDRFLPKDERREEHWFKAPLVPGTPDPSAGTEGGGPAAGAVEPPLCTLCRDGDRFIPAEYWLDSEDTHYSRVVGPVYATTPRLVREGEEIPVEGRRPRSFVVPDGSASYRLEAEEETGWGLPESVETAWEFTSAPLSGIPDGSQCAFGDSCTVQPAMQLRYDVPLDLLNRAPAGRLFGFELQAGAHPEAPGARGARHVEVEYTFDGGDTWWPALVLPYRDDSALVVVAHPSLRATDGFVSLRVQAKGHGGASTSQTIERAYALR